MPLNARITGYFVLKFHNLNNRTRTRAFKGTCYITKQSCIDAKGETQPKIQFLSDQYDIITEALLCYAFPLKKTIICTVSLNTWICVLNTAVYSSKKAVFLSVKVVL